jgi:hypothetical protein
VGEASLFAVQVPEMFLPVGLRTFDRCLNGSGHAMVELNDSGEPGDGYRIRGSG